MPDDNITELLRERFKSVEDSVGGLRIEVNRSLAEQDRSLERIERNTNGRIRDLEGWRTVAETEARSTRELREELEEERRGRRGKWWALAVGVASAIAGSGLLLIVGGVVR